jgi:hypothetical protein
VSVGTCRRCWLPGLASAQEEICFKRNEPAAGRRREGKRNRIRCAWLAWKRRVVGRTAPHDAPDARGTTSSTGDPTPPINKNLVVVQLAGVKKKDERREEK